jgi:hypothetical protein
VITLVVSSVALATTALASSAGAGVTPVGAAPLTILKTVSGVVPAGTTFTATIQCDDTIINDGGKGADGAVVQFDATGQPTTPDTVTFLAPGSCTVTESVTGGATSTTYACESTEPAEAPTGFGPGAQQVAEPICLSAGPQSGPITVNIIFENQTATVTIHNTFNDPTPVPITPAPQVVAQPAFTG